MRIQAAVLVVGFVLLATIALASHIPTQVTVQGKLTDASGVPLSAGLKTLTFRIFDASTLGAEIWPGGVGEIQIVTTGSDGLWIALVGALSPLNDAVFADTARWLEITVDDGVHAAQVLPRLRFATGPFAYRVATLDGATGGVVTGSVIVGQGHTVSGADVFVAGNQNTVDGNQTSIAGGSGNSATGLSAFIGGGIENVADGEGAVVAGGKYNVAGSFDAAITGGRYNEASDAAFVGGGLSNDAIGVQSCVVGGHGNTAAAIGAAVGGGFWNRARGDYSVVAGGGGFVYEDSNLALGNRSFVGAGSRNYATGMGSIIIGGDEQRNSGANGFIGGGYQNRVSNNDAAVVGGFANLASGYRSFIGSGDLDTAAGNWSTIGGGSMNQTEQDFSTVGGGKLNHAVGISSTIGGGYDNSVSGTDATIGGGFSNLASGLRSVIAGGSENEATLDYATVGGGSQNSATGGSSTISGGAGNRASGGLACVPGGVRNIASGLASMAAGSYAVATHDRSFVWGDGVSDYNETTSGSANQFKISASNGVQFAKQAGEAKTIQLGDHYRDNGIVAWGRVRSDGVVSTYELGVVSVTRNSAGNYTINLDVTASSSNTLIATATPELDTAPTTTATIRIAAVNQVDGNTFDVYINTGAGIAVDNDFMFMVTAR